MLKVKRLRTADCVVGGFRYEQGADFVGSLLLGLYDEEGLLHHVGSTRQLHRPINRPSPLSSRNLSRRRASPATRPGDRAAGRVNDLLSGGR